MAEPIAKKWCRRLLVMHMNNRKKNIISVVEPDVCNYIFLCR